MSGDIAVGVPVYTRTRALERLLDSVPSQVTTVYVADNGPDGARRALYNRDWEFNLKMLDLEYDVGIGACRAAIVDAVSEPYLWVGDSDMEFLRDGDLEILREIIDTNVRIGGVAGWLREKNTIRAAARNLHEHGDTLVQAVREQPRIERVPYPYARFDLIPQAALMRTDVFDTYSYDAELYNTEHVDFFIGHQRAGEWDFASTPLVTINHNKNIEPHYRQARGQDSTADFERIEDKFGIRHVVPGQRGEWFGNERTFAERVFDVMREYAPVPVWRRLRDFCEADVDYQAVAYRPAATECVMDGCKNERAHGGSVAYCVEHGGGS